MIIYSNKNIAKWRFWRKKSKLTFCLASGLFYAVLALIGSISGRLIFGLDQLSIEDNFLMLLGMLLPATFMSIALWYENEKRFKEWELENKG